MAKTAESFAPAKINLTLHVTGVRADGYHILDSLVAFAGVGDRVRVAAGPPGFTVDGPQAAGLAGEGDNLVLRAAQLLAPEVPEQITLTKNLPLASGIGGGSADAAAALRALAEFRNLPLPPLDQIAALGADVPACLHSRPARMRGIGDDLSAVPSLPELEILLVNPGVQVPTPAVFAGLTTKTNPPMPKVLPDWPSAEAFCAWLKTQRNDLTIPAVALAPVIADVLSRLQNSGCLFAGMSGSGATCFGIYPADGRSAAAARARIAAQKPHWWVVSTDLQPGFS